MQWDIDFADFEKTCLPSEKDIRRLTATHLKRLFAEREPAEKVTEVLGLPPAAEIDEATDASASADTEKATAAALSSLSSSVALTVSDAPSTSFREETTASAQSNTGDAGKDAEGVPLKAQGQKDDKAAVDSDINNVSPTISRRPSRFTSAPSTPIQLPGHGRFITPGTEESSCTESEVGGQVTSLVKRFETPVRTQTTGTLNSGSRTGTLSRRRPGLRRGKTEESVPTSSIIKRRSQPREDVLSDGDDAPQLSQTSGPSRSSSPTRKPGLAPPSRIPTRPLIRQRSTSGSRLDALGSPRRPSSAQGPPSSYRPPKGVEGGGLKAGPRAIIGRSQASADAASASERLGPAERASTSRSRILAPSGDSVTPRTGIRPPPLSAQSSKSSLRSPSTLRPPLSRGKESGTKSRVSTIARHFDRLNREAERERERQRQMMAIRARRARPVAVTHAKVEVFSSVRDAVKDDESDSDSDDDGASADAEDESEESDTDKGGDADQHPPRSSTPIRQAKEDAGQDVIVPPSVSVGPPSSQLPASAPPDGTEPPPLTPAVPHHHEMDSDAPSASVPPSPNVSNTLPATLRNGLPSDGESSGAERHSLLKTLSGFWAFRTGDIVPLEYPL